MEEIFGKDFYSVVIVGNWNIPIFNPEWVRANLFTSQEKDMSVEYPTQIIGASFRFTQDPLCFSIVNNRMQLSITENTDAARLAAIEFMYLLLRKLVYTPIASTGINFKFKETTDADNLHSETELQMDMMQPIISKIITEKYKYSENVTLTYEKVIGESFITHDFNYSFVTRDVNALLQILEDEELINSLHQKTKELLHIA